MEILTQNLLVRPKIRFLFWTPWPALTICKTCTQVFVYFPPVFCYSAEYVIFVIPCSAGIPRIVPPGHEAVMKIISFALVSVLWIRIRSFTTSNLPTKTSAIFSPQHHHHHNYHHNYNNNHNNHHITTTYHNSQQNTSKSTQ